MRYVVGLAVALALVALPLGVSAQASEEDRLSSWQVYEGTSGRQPASEEPALELKLDEAGVEVVPSAPRTPDAQTLEEMYLRRKRARIGLSVSILGW